MYILILLVLIYAVAYKIDKEVDPMSYLSHKLFFIKPGLIVLIVLTSIGLVTNSI